MNPHADLYTCTDTCSHLSITAGSALDTVYKHRRLLPSSRGVRHQRLQCSSHLRLLKDPTYETQVKVVCRRIGGAFGGKASRAMPVAAAAAVAASKLKRRVRLVLNRNQDMHQNAGDALIKYTQVAKVDRAGCCNMLHRDRVAFCTLPRQIIVVRLARSKPCPSFIRCLAWPRRASYLPSRRARWGGE